MSMAAGVTSLMDNLLTSVKESALHIMQMKLIPLGNTGVYIIRELFSLPQAILSAVPLFSHLLLF